LSVVNIIRIIGFFRRLKRFGYIRCDITLSVFFIDSSSCDLFHMLCLPKQSGHRSLPPLRKCSYLWDRDHPYELTDVWSPIEQPWPQSNWLQNMRHNSATSLPDKSAGSEWFNGASIDVWARVEQRYWHAIDQRFRRFHACLRVTARRTL